MKKYPTYGIVYWRDVSSSDEGQELKKREQLCLKFTIGKIDYDQKSKTVSIICEETLSVQFSKKGDYSVAMPEGCVDEIIPLYKKTS